jgi:hypothetical protein
MKDKDLFSYEWSVQQQESGGFFLLDGAFASHVVLSCCIETSHERTKVSKWLVIKG